MRLPLVAFLAALVVLTRVNAQDKRQTAGPTCVKQDIVYMIDSSSYIGVENFQQQLDFIKNNIRYYNINPACTRVGIVTYSSGAYNQFYLNQYTSQQQLINAINNIHYHPGGRNTGDVINFVSSYGFSASNGGRAGVPHYGILVTGSTSSSPQLTSQAAQNAKKQGITLFTVGVGNGVDGNELSSITGNVPKNTFYAKGYNSLNTLSAPLATRINGAVSPQIGSNLGTPQACLQQADIVFMVDGSGSIGQQNFNKMENFLKGLVGKLDVGPNKVHVGLMQFSSRPQQEFPLNMYSSRQDVMTGIDQMNYMRGSTNTADALRMLREQLFSTSHGARPNVPRIGVIITDGKSANSAATATQANNARKDNIGLIAVGVGSGADINELHSIADDPDSANSFIVSNFDQLDNIAAQIIQRACQVSATAPPPTAKSVQGTAQPDPCQDKIGDCASYGKSVCSGDYFGWAKDNCPRYCGFCVPMYTTAPPPCVDRLNNCNEYQASSCVGEFESWAKDNCRKYCGYCDATDQSVGFYGHCYYKGKTYSEGEKWEDGCDYSCTCIDGVTGQYQCYNKCPVYYNLPSQCTLVKSDTQCCLQPVCDFKPQISTTETTSPGKTPDGVDVCVFNNRQYYQGQTWEDGCQFSCTCTNAKTGVYKCQTLCPTYASLPSYCHMETTAGECCQKPVCEFQTQTGSFSGSGTISGHGTGVSPTAPPACVDVIPDCDRYGQDACTNFKPWARDNCRKTCQLCVDNTPNPDPTDVCIYNGRAFHQGDSWQVGCDTQCTCENAVYGYYRCVNTCPKYNNIPSQCREEKKAGECCTKIVCSTGTFISSTGNLGTIGNGGLIQVGPGGAVPTIPSGGTPAPGTGGTVFRPPSLKGCLYKGQMYIQGQRWEDGCQYACECKKSDTGMYECTAKCPTFPNLPAECQLIVDPSDQCCQKPNCTFTGTPQPVVPVFPPSTSGQSVVEPPKPGDLYQGTQTVISIFTGSGSNPNIPTADPNIHGGIGHCEYKGKIYQQAEMWQDGCQYNCVCEDSTRGFYRCRDRCPTYPPLPPQCTMITDPADTCCKKPSCSFTGVQTVIVGQSNITTPYPITHQPSSMAVTTPQPKVCVYKNQQYSQGQSWYDGCDYKCSCDNADSGYYRCQRRCPEFFNVPSGCVYVPDPNDPSCCRAPQCTPTPKPGQTLAPGAIPTIAPGTFVGAPNATGYVGYCEYNGKLYQQGDTWQDGCDYSCTCMDAAKGQYKCVDKCPSYGALPPQCQMVADFTNPCCKKPECNFNGNFGQITGTLTPAPAPGSTPSPQPGGNPTPAPAPKYCVYKTASYSQGQTWNDGCQYKCRCDDSSRGLYTCNERCPRYENIPPQCTMVTDPNDSCCTQPKCNFQPTIGQTTGTAAPNPNPNNTPAPNPNPNPNPTLAPNPNPIPTKVPAVIIGQANTPAPTPLPNGQYPSPQPLNFCVYKGVQYKQGERWDDGCDYECVCEDASMAKYKCTEKCPKYTNIPPQCTLMKDAAKPCCFKPVCNFNPTTGQITGQLTTQAPQPGQQPTPAPQPGQTVAPNPGNPNPYPTPGLPKDVCVYRTDQYTQGQQWFDGCNFKCTCEDAQQGIYRCSERCTKYSSLPAGCTLVADPSDPLCCKVPQCAPNPNSNSSQPYPTPPPGHVTGGSVTPAPTPMNTPAPQPGVSTQKPSINPTPAPTPVCVYKGKTYTQGQRWQDGCDYNCVCINADMGRYDCTEICPKYPNLPPQCTLVQDFNQPCCKKPECNFLGTTSAITGTLAPTPGGPTLAPSPGYNPTPRPSGPTPAPTPKTYCKYNGVVFRQGQRWDDGCDLQCVCENEMTGYYRCNQSLNEAVDTTFWPPSDNKGEYSCDLQCVCENEMTGYFRCNQRCAKYPSVPQGCTLETDPNDPCCRIPVCRNMPTPAPNPYNTPGPNPTGPSPTLAPGLTPAPGQTLSPNPNPNPNPTPGPGQTFAPNPNPTPGPGQTPNPNPTPYIPTLAPPLINGQGVTPTPQPGVTTLKPPIPVCVYNGKSYTQGQTWQDGCQYNCVCVDASTGQYQCSQRCPVYPSIPSNCRLVTSQSDPCCKEPQCTQAPTPQPNPYNTPQPNPTPSGGSTVKPPLNPNPVNTPGPNPNPNPQNTPAPTPQPRQFCVVNGKQYTQGQQWNDGCDRVCVCDDQSTGHYKCSDRCKRYTSIPNGCTMVPDPADPICCQVPQCIPIPGTNGNPTPSPTDGPTMYTNAPHAVVTGMATPTPAPTGPTPAPVPGQSTPVPTPAPKVCVYKGQMYAQGQRWQDGCDFDCICEDGMTGKYKCTARCGSYPNLPRQCQLQRDPKDYCCYVPVCDWNSNPTPQPNPYNTPSPNVTPRPGLPTLAPQPGQTVAPTPGPGQSPAPTPLPQPKTLCVYNGVTFAQGQVINDGCTQRCRCDDADTNYYNCYDRCADYPNLPSNCYMVTDPKDSCCQIPKCTVQPTPAPNPYLTPAPGQTYPPGMVPTPAPGQTYPPGMVPTPGPGQTYPTPAPGQTYPPGLIPTPAPGQTYAPGKMPTPGPGQTYAPGKMPTPGPGQTPSPGVYPYPSPSPLPTAVPGQIINKPDPTRPPSQQGFCVYKGVKYQKGQKWDDGCNYVCECLDDMTGQYRCIERCPKYPTIPAYCIMVQDPNDQCCKVPSCPGLQPTPAPGMTPAPIPGQTLAPGVYPTPAPGQTYPPGMVPTPAPGQTYAPGFFPTPAPGQTYAPGKMPTPGPVQTYAPGLFPTPAPGQTYAPGMIPTPGPGQTYAPGLFPTPGPNQTPSPNPTPMPQPIPKDVCIMNGKSYTQGQQWYDGCKQICVCDDGVTGHYTCNQRCSVYKNIPPTCVYVPDPNDPICCQIPQCNSPNSTIPQPVTGTHTGGGPQPTPRPNPYLTPAPGQVTQAPYLTPAPGQTPAPGRTYAPGYTFSPYLTPAPGQTPAPGRTYAPGYTFAPYLTPAPGQTPAPGRTYAPGYTFAPSPNPRTTPAPPKVCVYKGNTYTQGQSWRDGCLYDCTCDDAMNGKYTCNDICPKYPGLPPYCTMVYDPMNPCCKKPECSTPAPRPLGGSTPAPVPGVVPTPQPNPTPATNFCVYNGIPLPKGQVFNDGCDKVCRCEDPMMNDVVCDERCPTYPPLRGGCSMVTDPRDSCCQVPQCTPNPGTSPNTTVITGVPGTISGQNQPKPNPGTGPVVGTRDVCLYHGVMYKTGDKWDDGCTYTCICVDGNSGSYRCTEKCPRYPKVPAQCSMVKDPSNPCCEKPKCSYIPPTPAPNPTPAPLPGVTQSPTPGTNPNPNPNPNVTPGPNPNPNPNNTPVPNPGTIAPTPAPRMVCQYKNQYYRQDQVWYDDCNAICQCENAATGYYRCQERCAKYPSVPATCTLVPDPKDPTCCKVASCPLTPTGPAPTPGFIQPNPNTPAPPQVTGIAPVPTPSGPYASPNPQNTPAPQPGVSPNPNVNPTPAPQPKTGCFYKGVTYKKGQTWQDGCDYDCVCIDDMTGQYSCTKRCADYPQVPPQCVMMQDPNDACCKKPYCDFVNPTPFPNGIPTPQPNPNQSPAPGPQTTLAPGIVPTPAPPGYCVYKGTFYTQGQTWNDGCDKKCRCDDVSTGYYSCTNRCPVYNNYPSNCQLVTDPNDNCCLVPDCNTFSVTPAPGTGPSGTNNPLNPFNPGTLPGVTGYNPSTTPGSMVVVPTYIPGTFTGSSNNNPNGNTQVGPSGRNNVCVYKGAIHRQGDKWDDSCSFQCTCVDETRGLYSCTERCPRYVNLPPYCTYKTDPRDPCCKVASCDLSNIPTPGPVTPTPKPTIPGVYSPGVNTGPSGSNNSYTFQPGTNPGYTGTKPPQTFRPGTGPAIAGTNQPFTPQPGTGTSGLRDKCIYKDMTQHPKGSTWQDGCDYTCVCEDPTTNSYRCNARCPSYSDLPASCFLVTDPNDPCCKVPQCSGTLNPITGTGVQPTQPGSNVVPVGTHTTFSGSGRPDVVPGMTATGSRSVCVYKGSAHQQGESWDDGCQYTCTCTDANRGLYTCTSKCPAFPSNIPSYCKMNTVPGMCCKSLSCNIPTLGSYNPAPQLVPTPAPTSSPGATPTPSSGNPPQVIYPSGTQPVIGNTQFPGNGYGIPPGTQITDIRNQCVYKNRIYNQGETWEDGCQYECECKDAKTGFYECRPLCPVYRNLPQGCYTVKAAGQCCEQPVCQKPDGSTFNPVTNPMTGYPVYGSYTPGMSGFRPGYNPSTGITGTQVVTGQSNRCIYKGKIYGQGQSWDDGCEYSCQCTDAQNGMYSCSPQCPTYTSLPSACQMVTLPGQCCQEPRCKSQPQPTFAVPNITPAPHLGSCYDAISNCNAYGKSSCVAPYVEWAKQNCNAYCGFCTTGTTNAPQQCMDKKSDCASYGQQACTGAYVPWARDNCAKTCNLCSTFPASVVTIAPQPTTPGCVDKISNCVDYGQAGCQAPYEQWAYDNCRKTCGLCTASFNTPSSISGGLPTNNWMILLKGVAGAPGPDLYSLWNSPNTLNEKVPEAMYLTSQYNGHYKPDLSNYWNSLCIDKVKVAIFNNGQEMANIIFDASGADKNSWFDPSRIISSTWTDIKYAPKNLFSMIGDQVSGHEFAMTSSGNGCNVQGWMMISTQSNCNFEQGANKPAFYYAPGQSSTNFGSSTLASGDVFAILAHPNCNGVGPTAPASTITATSNFCIYKNKIYRQGETWQDGCKYNCTCEDGQTGFYRCLNLCPVWDNLPPQCTLKKPAGECCDKPDCNGISFGQTNLTDTCFYNGNYYRQGQTWKDGCKYQCSCEDGKTGFYKCSTLCLQWNLPSSCHMDPPPAGKCCQVPVCPSNIKIQYPPNYVQQ